MKRHHVPRWPCPALVVLAALVALDSGCASPRAALGTSQSTCFHALPAAADAVGHQGVYAGLRRVSLSANQAPLGFGPRPAPRTSSTLSSPGSTTTVRPRPSAICLVAFRGTFDASRISLLRGPSRSGRYAIVVVGLRTGTAHAVYLTERLPRAFNHL